MTTNPTIDGVPRELLLDVEYWLKHMESEKSVEGQCSALKELRALLDAKPVMCHGCTAEGVSPDHFDSAGKCKAAQPQGEPVAWLFESPKNLEAVQGFTRVKALADRYVPAGWTVTPVYAEQPAPVAVVLPERLIGLRVMRDDHLPDDLMMVGDKWFKILNPGAKP